MGICQNKISSLPPRASAIKEQGFFEAVTARIEAPQEDQPDPSVRQSGATSGGLQGTSYKVNSQLPPVSVSGREVSAKYH